LQSFFNSKVKKITASKGFDRYALALAHIKHDLTTAMQHLVVTGKVLRGLSD